LGGKVEVGFAGGIRGEVLKGEELFMRRRNERES